MPSGDNNNNNEGEEEELDVGRAVLRACLRPSHPRAVEEARALIERHGVNLNAHEYGAYREPLLHACARTGYSHACRMLRTLGADPEQRNAQGETPLFLMLRHTFNRSTPRNFGHLARLVGGDLNAPATARALAVEFVAACDTDALVALVELGMRVPQRCGLLHRALALGGARLFQALLDRCGQDPGERDAEGRTLLQAALELRGAPRFVEVLLDAGWAARAERDAAVAMALHPRLGAGSPLRALDAELLRTLVLPHALRREDVARTRERRLDALMAAEGLTEEGTRGEAREAYVRRGAPFQPSRFRREHFIARSAEFHRLCAAEEEEDPDLVRHTLRRRLKYHGILFDAPLTPEYTLLAEAAVARAIPYE